MLLRRDLEQTANQLLVRGRMLLRVAREQLHTRSTQGHSHLDGIILKRPLCWGRSTIGHNVQCPQGGIGVVEFRVHRLAFLGAHSRHRRGGWSPYGTSSGP